MDIHQTAKIAEIQVCQEKKQNKVKLLLCIGLRQFLTKKCLSPAILTVKFFKALP